MIFRLVLAVSVLAATGLWATLGADGAAVRRDQVVSGVPLHEVHPANLPPGERRPGVVVAHGYAGSARLMAPFGDSLAARGYVVVLLDFAGHGASNGRLDMDTTLSDDLDVALTHLRGLPDVDPTRTALVGHSMGATAVTRYAAEHPDITTTVAISLPDATQLPGSLLTVVGALELPAFHYQATQAEAAGAEKLVVPGVEHVTVLYATRTHERTAAWLDTSFGRTPEGTQPWPWRRVAGAGLLLVALILGIVPMSRALLGPPADSSWRLRVGLRSVGRTAVVAAVAVTVAALVAPVLPTARMPLELGGYLAGFAVVAGALLWAYARWKLPVEPSPRRMPWMGLLLVPYAAVTIAAPLHLGLTHAVPTGERWWLLAVVWTAFGLMAYASARLTNGRAVSILLVSAIATVALTAAAVLGLTAGFLILIVPMLAALFLCQAAWSAVLLRYGSPRWLTAAATSLLVAWPLAVALPLA